MHLLGTAHCWGDSIEGYFFPRAGLHGYARSSSADCCIGCFNLHCTIQYWSPQETSSGQYSKPEVYFFKVVNAFRALGQGRCNRIGVDDLQEYVASEQEGSRLNTRLSPDKDRLQNQLYPGEHPMEKWENTRIVSSRLVSLTRLFTFGPRSA